MAHSYIHDGAAQVIPNRATGYSPAKDGFRKVVRTYTDVVVGNSGLFTTAADLLAGNTTSRILVSAARRWSARWKRR